MEAEIREYSTEKVETQVKRREQGNVLFKAGDYVAALTRYDEALECASWASEVRVEKHMRDAAPFQGRCSRPSPLGRCTPLAP